MSLYKRIIPAIIADNQEELEDRINKVSNYVEIIQLDFMDGKFVQNKSIDFDFKLPKTGCKFEAHLMIEDPDIWIENNFMKVDTILVHIESIKDPLKIIKHVKEKTKNIGFVLNPETPIKKIEKYLDRIDQILIMTVNPGFYGSPFLPKMLQKIKKLRVIKPILNIEVDGGITNKTIELVNKAGANFFVSGSYIIKSDNIKESINNLKKIIDYKW
jgi:ribulose-phosphate 3-epimerase